MQWTIDIIHLVRELGATGLPHYRATDTGGHTTFSMVQEGEYVVLVRSPGYYPALQRRRSTAPCPPSTAGSRWTVLYPGVLMLTVSVS